MARLPIGHRVLLVLVALTALLVLIDVVGRWISLIWSPTGVGRVIVEATRLDAERGLMNWLSIALLAGAATLAVMTARRERRAGTRWWRHWLGLALVSLLLSFDEQVGLFELSAVQVVSAFSGSGAPTYLFWLVPACLVIATLAVIYLGFFRALPRPVAGWLGRAALVYTLGAVGLELVSHFLGAGGWDISDPSAAMVRDGAFALEEAFEFLGVSLGVVGIIDYLTMHTRPADPPPPGLG